jgi:hypothetical protein
LGGGFFSCAGIAARAFDGGFFWHR